MIIAEPGPRNSKRTFTFRVPVPFRLDAVVRSHGWYELQPWQWEAGVLSRRERIGPALGIMSMSQPRAEHIRVAWRTKRGPTPHRPAVYRVIARSLSWDWDHIPFLAVANEVEPSLGHLVCGGAGRFLRGTTFYEDFLKTVCTINTTWSSTQRMVGKLVGLVGRGVFPTPEKVLAFGEAALKDECRLGYRAATVFRCTRRMLADGTLTAPGNGDAAALSYAYLMSLPGIGPYAAAHCRVLLHDFSRLPIDSGVTEHLREIVGLKEKQFEPHFSPWGDYRFLGYKLQRLAKKLQSTNAV
jgi:N-glycosylase/DNA lyase